MTRLTVPNVLTTARILGAAPLATLAWFGQRNAFIGFLAFLLLTDLIDGPIARRLGQQGKTGARLDTIADGLLYIAVALSFWWLETDAFRAHLPWFWAVFVSWLLSVAVSLVRFGRLPSYHTWLAKTSALVVGPVALAWIVAGWTAGIPWALAFVTLANVEAAAIGAVLPEWRSDVTSLGRAQELRRLRS